MLVPDVALGESVVEQTSQAAASRVQILVENELAACDGLRQQLVEFLDFFVEPEDGVVAVGAGLAGQFDELADGGADFVKAFEPGVDHGQPNAGV